MGLRSLPFRKVYPHIRGRVLSLGYPDLVLPVEEIEQITGKRPLITRTTGKWHKVTYALAESRALFEQIGADLECVDIAEVRGGERIVDLNLPCDLGQYELVIDPGTLEHCFNIGQAFLNMANAVKVGGVAFHCSPLSRVNHGFYNLCPTLFHDFYLQNGWEVEIVGTANDKEMMLPFIDRFGVVPEMELIVIAKRRFGGAMKFPVQTKYLINPKLKAA